MFSDILQLSLDIYLQIIGLLYWVHSEEDSVGWAEDVFSNWTLCTEPFDQYLFTPSSTFLHRSHLAFQPILQNSESTMSCRFVHTPWDFIPVLYRNWKVCLRFWKIFCVNWNFLKTGLNICVCGESRFCIRLYVALYYDVWWLKGKSNITDRSLGPLRGLTSSWRPFGPALSLIHISEPTRPY